MNVPKAIADKAQAYIDHMKEAVKNYNEVKDWLNENTESSGVYITDLFLTDTPTGNPQGEGEYCDQSAVGWTGDSFAGKYYHPIEGSKQYLGYDYEC